MRVWADLPPKQQAAAARGPRRPRPLGRGPLVLGDVGRLPGRSHQPQGLWRWGHGPGVPDLAVLWRASGRRCALEHRQRCLKQPLGWVTPRARHPPHADRWPGLVLVADTSLRLARPAVADRRLPWERRLPPQRRMPYRVQRGLLALRPALGTRASAPKPGGRSPGRPKDRCSGAAPRYPALNKAA